MISWTEIVGVTMGVSHWHVWRTGLLEQKLTC